MHIASLLLVIELSIGYRLQRKFSGRPFGNTAVNADYAIPSSAVLYSCFVGKHVEKKGFFFFAQQIIRLGRELEMDQYCSMIVHSATLKSSSRTVAAVSVDLVP